MSTRDKLENGEYETKLVYELGLKKTMPKPAENSKDVDRYAEELKDYHKWKEDRERDKKRYEKDRQRLIDLFWDDLMEEFFPTLEDEKVWKVRSFIYNKMDSKLHAIEMAEEISEFF